MTDDPYWGVPKDEWGDGPWQDEPDETDVFVSFGLQCRCRRGPAGAWNGYVLLPIDTFVRLVERQEHEGWGGRPYSSWEFIGEEPYVHGGVTYCAPGPPWDPAAGVGCVGFDMHHFMDYAPAFEARMRMLPAIQEIQEQHEALMDRVDPAGEHRRFLGPHYRTLDDCITETQDLAYQLRYYERPPFWSRTLGWREMERDARKYPRPTGAQ